MKDEYQKNDRTPPKDKQTARCFLGAVEFACFLKQGAGRYTDSKADAIASFWIVAAALLFDILFLLSIKENNEILKDWSMDQIVIFGTIRTVFVYSMNILFTYTLCRIHQKTDNILKFVTAYNWLASFQMVLLSPLLIMLALGIHTTAEMYRLSGFDMDLRLFNPCTLDQNDSENQLADGRLSVIHILYNEISQLFDTSGLISPHTLDLTLRKKRTYRRGFSDMAICPRIQRIHR